MELSCTRGAHFEKITFFGSDSFFYEIWPESESQKAAQMAPKSIKKLMRLFMHKIMFLFMENGPQGDPTGTSKID